MKKNISYFADFGSKNRPYTGGYYFAECLLDILRELDINLNVFSATIPKIDKDHSYASGEEIRKIELPIGGFGNPRVGLCWALKLRQELKKMPKQDLYVFDQPMTLINFLPKASTIAMFHGSDFVGVEDLSIFHPRDFLFGLFWRKLFLNKIHKKFLLKEIGTPLFNSNDTLNQLSSDFNLDPHPLEKYITYLPIDTEKFKRDENERNAIRKQCRIADDEIVIVALSNFDPVKRADRLSSIIVKFLNDSLVNNIKILLIGGGRMSKPIDDLAKNFDVSQKAENDKSLFCAKKKLFSIIRIGQIPHRDVYKFYSAADIALSTSERESFGYFIAEGMATQLPFIAYSGGAIEEVIVNNSTGFIVESEDDFIKSLNILVKNKDLIKQMAEAGRKRIEEMFSVPVFKDRFLEILDKEFNLNL